ncbi:MAG: cytidyltransferase [Candidatus Omnitrophica bacterium CG11_big_fil_rev_8_21_14_0_20_64_10]|nr:MAG: cytidyltransferase [Candidatus Omnitrophica bacterium CG11_big_fil_rev_8_21_14_0_20_64_10]
MSEVIALIPARGGSKGVPRKNLQPLSGKPLLVHSIETALGCPEIRRVLVSTDDPEIAEAARKAGAEAPFLRPADLSGDTVPDWPVFEHALHWIQKETGNLPELVVHLRPTHPVREIPVIRQAIGRMRRHPEADALRSVSVAAQTPYKMWRSAGEFLEPLLTLPGIPEPYSQPRQRLPMVYWQNGYVDVIRSRTLLEKRSMTGQKILSLVVERPWVEIDDWESFAEAERCLKERDRILAGETPAPAPVRHPS